MGAASNFSGDIIRTSVLSGVQGSSSLGVELEDEHGLDEEYERWLSLSLDLARCLETTVETPKFPCWTSLAEVWCIMRLV